MTNCLPFVIFHPNHCTSVLPNCYNRLVISPDAKKQVPTFLLVTIILMAGIFRFGWAGVHSFSFDEARVSMIALKMVFEGEFARLGMQSSVGVPNFPATVWLYAIPYAIFGANVQMATWFTGFIALLAIPAVYVFGRWRWGVWGGLTAALLFALSPTMLVYGRNIWSQNFLAPLTVFWLVAGYKGILPIVEERPSNLKSNAWLVLFVFLSGFIGQVHIAGLAFALPGAYLFFRFKLWRNLIPLIIGGAIALLAAFPALYTIWRFGDGARADLNSALAEPSTWNSQVWRMMVQLPLNIGWEFHWLGGDWQWGQPIDTLAQLTIWLLAVLLLLGFGLAVAQTVKRLNGSADIRPADSLWLNLVFGALLATPLFFLYSGSDVAIHYILPAFPAGILLMAGVGTLFPNKQQGGILVFALIALICAVYAVQLTQGLNIIAKQLAPGGMGTPLSYPQAALDKTLNGADQAIVVSHSDQIEFEGDPAVFHVLGYENDVRLVDGTASLLIPADNNERVGQTFTFDFIPAWSMAQRISDGAILDESPRREGEPPYRILDLSADQLIGFTMLADSVALENGATLTGYQINQVNDSQLEFITLWQIGEDATGEHVQQFNHLYIEGGEGPAEVRDIYTSSRAWRAQDSLVTWVVFNVPEGAKPIYLHTGMYTLPNVERVPKSQADGDPLFPIQIDLE